MTKGPASSHTHHTAEMVEKKVIPDLFKQKAILTRRQFG